VTLEAAFQLTWQTMETPPPGSMHTAAVPLHGYKATLGGPWISAHRFTWTVSSLQTGEIAVVRDQHSQNNHRFV